MCVWCCESLCIRFFNCPSLYFLRQDLFLNLELTSWPGNPRILLSASAVLGLQVCTVMIMWVLEIQTQVLKLARQAVYWQALFLCPSHPISCSVLKSVHELSLLWFLCLWGVGVKSRFDRRMDLANNWRYLVFLTFVIIIIIYSLFPVLGTLACQASTVPLSCALALVHIYNCPKRLILADPRHSCCTGLAVHKLWNVKFWIRMSRS